MGWPYQFVDLDEAEKHARRLSLDRYANYAQLSALLPIAVVLLYRLGSWLAKRVSSQSERGVYEAVPNSPALKHRRQSVSGPWLGRARSVAWSLGDDVMFLGINWGRRGQLVVGVAWTLWLVFLCVVGTGNDYLHLTKRFGIVGLSQLPLQYLLALKNINPIAFAFGSSYEQVNRWHQTLGWIVYFLLLTHACLYLNFYVQQSILAERLTHLVPLLGLASIIGLSFMSITVLKIIRRYSYRVFFITHVMVALLLPPAIFFHSHHSGRPYVVVALGVFLLDLIKRNFDTFTAPATLELIPGTSLIKIAASIPPNKLSRFRKYPGMHVYLTIPAAARRVSNMAPMAFLLLEFAFNPFTIASVNEESGDLTLVARKQKGPMTRALARFADNELTATKLPLNIEGPYGCATQFPNLAGPAFDRILLVAGGVGATFILPLYRPVARVQMVWAVRGPGDATWPVSGTAGSILDDENIHLFLTGDVFADTDEAASPSDEDEGIELNDNVQANLEHTRKRPDLQRIVDDLFRHGVEDRVAVLVCGPEEMARELRAAVGVWVKKGRNVWWHNETFAW
ncbi:metalloreductase Fre8 [Hypoxylon sp. NC1633]|nr:metalloreductase Fre8 [Hypoxylon sp. NC1633]